MPINRRVAGVRTYVVRYVLALTLLSLAVAHYAVWPPDTMLVLALLLCAGLGQFRAFAQHLAPFIGLFVLYAFASSIADDLNPHINYMLMPHFDEWVGGGELPTKRLQSIMWNGHVQWYDFYFYFLYTMHFLAPLIVAFFLWKRRPHLYWSYVASIALLCLAAFTTYVLYPAAPPWMSSDYHFIEPIHRVSFDIWSAVGINQPDSLYGKLSPNLVAAVPSLHSSFPLLTLIFLARSFGWRRVWWAAIYPISMWIGVVYLGEHYVFDVVAGVLYTLITCLVATKAVTYWTRRRAPALSEPEAMAPELV
jgi:membrane-associated phospholipid phosphatase